MGAYRFNSIFFDMIVPASRETPHWKVVVEATDRKLIGTDRFERSIRSRQYILEGELYIEASETLGDARVAFEALQDAYLNGLIAALELPNLGGVSAMILSFEAVPLLGGQDGYRGKVVFGRPGGVS